MRRVLCSIVIALALVVLCGVNASAAEDTVATSAATPQVAKASWTFEGCFSWFPSGPCYDAYRDPSGDLWICGRCGTTKNPSETTCSPLNPVGWWCS